MGKMSKEVPRPLFPIWKLSHAIVLVMDIFPSFCSSYRTPFYFCHLLVIFLFSFSQILVITEEFLLLLDHTMITPFVYIYYGLCAGSVQYISRCTCSRQLLSFDIISFHCLLASSCKAHDHSYLHSSSAFIPVHLCPAY